MQAREGRIRPVNTARRRNRDTLTCRASDPRLCDQFVDLGIGQSEKSRQDLAVVGSGRRRGTFVAGFAGADLERKAGGPEAVQHPERRMLDRLYHPARLEMRTFEDVVNRELGRTSCRESVCKDV